VGDRGSASLRTAFTAELRRILRRARFDLVVRRGTVGLFYGLLPGLAAALCAGTFTLPFPVLLVAACSAAAGLAAGAAAGLLARMDPQAVLVSGDRLLATRELSSTALELSARAAPGRFADAVIEDAASLLRTTASRRFLGRLRLPLAPFIPLVAALTAAALIFPIDLRLFFARSERERELVDIGESLQKQGQALENDSRASNLGRSLALSQELAQLGRELATGKLTLDEALDRMSELEGRLAQEYQLALQEWRAISPPSDYSEGQDSTAPDSSPPGSGNAQPGDSNGVQNGNSSQDLKGLGDALKKLREDRRRLSESRNQDAGKPGSTAQGPPGISKPGAGTSAPESGSDSHSGTGSGSAGRGKPGGHPGEGDESGMNAGSQAGTAPAPVKRGDPTAISRGSGGPSLKADGSTGEGEMARLLARSLPDLSGSKLPDATVLDQYARQAESALARDEVSQKLREYVKGYFTNIGMPASNTKN
jgi:hypothetical protein